jgi:hypothetical protein
MPVSHETRADKRKPWRVDGLPRPRRCSGEQLRRLSARVHQAARHRTPTIDGKRRFAVITSKRDEVIQYVIREGGWRGHDRLFIGQIAAACDTSEDTVLNALADAEAYGWIRRHAAYRPAEDGTKRRDASVFELLCPEPQGADGSCTTDSIFHFQRRRRALAERRRDAKQTVLGIFDATWVSPDPEKARAVMEKCGW